MVSATYDNPTNMRREAWRDGSLVAYVSFKMLHATTTCLTKLHKDLNVGPWRTGQVLGDPEAVRMHVDKSPDDLWLGYVKRGARKPSKTYSYWWHGMPEGTLRECGSPADAFLSVMLTELRITKLATLLVELSIPSASVSRCRHNLVPIPHEWFLRAMVISGIPYEDFCKLTGEEPKWTLHHNARKLK